MNFVKTDYEGLKKFDTKNNKIYSVTPVTEGNEFLKRTDFIIIFENVNKKTEPILDEAERKYLSGVIRPFRDRIRYITKNAYIMSGDKREFISICTFNGVTPLPYFKKDSMYKGMELNKEYTLEELGL